MPSSNNKQVEIDKNIPTDNNLHIFVQPGCGHCTKAKKFLSTVRNNYSNIDFIFHDITQRNEQGLFLEYAARLNLDLRRLGTPIIVLKNKHITGYLSDEETGQEILNLLNDSNHKTKTKDKKTINLPIFGEINLFNTSLPLLTIMMGLADGFNPCAMWVLIYLISIVSQIKDRRKIWFLVGAFVLSSGILYFLFMTAWLNTFLYVGYIRSMAITIGLFAIYFGTMCIHEYIKNKGMVQCKLSKNKTRKKAMNKIEKLAMAKLSFATIMGIVFLAFVVNSVEFLCSAALPATYTYVLTTLELSTFMYYFYILFYTLFFMLDDLIIFGLAAFAINKYANGNKYEKYSTIVGGILMVLIGVFIIFFPNSL